MAPRRTADQADGAADPISPLGPIIQEFAQPDWTSPIWWVGVVTSCISELVVILTLFGAGKIATELTAIGRSQIVIVAQIMAVAIPAVIGWLHHRAKVSVAKAQAQAVQSFNNAVAQIHYNQSTVRLVASLRALPAPQPPPAAAA